jgi:hypothetical protein
MNIFTAGSLGVEVSSGFVPISNWPTQGILLIAWSFA